MKLDKNYRLISDEHNYILQRKVPLRTKKRAGKTKEGKNVGNWNDVGQALASLQGTDYMVFAILGGEGGIRTRGTVTHTHAFQACSLSHSDTSPEPWKYNSEEVGFEPTCPAHHQTTRFRVGPVTSTSVLLHIKTITTSREGEVKSGEEGEIWGINLGIKMV